MSEEKVPNELRYTKSHEWVKVEGDVATVGVTDHAQAQLTDIVFVDLPAAGKAAVKGTGVLVLESVKTVADVNAPGNGSVVEGNGELKAHPE
ncbi:MAG: glycine cleavage system protein H, partial [Thermoplasmata archaeon]